jgi:hypothetical protein
MDKGRNLLPWILGGLSMAIVAIAITVAWAKGIAPNNSPAPSQTAAHVLPDAQPTTAPTPAPTPPFRVAQIRPMAPVAPKVEPNRSVWECTISGQKTFSDNPCGNKSRLREIGPVNRMDPTPILPHSRSYAPESSGQPRYSYPSEQADSYPGDQQSADNSYPADNPYPADDSYPVFVGNSFDERRRRNHEERRRPDHEERRRPDHEERRGPDHEHRPYSQPYSRDRGLPPQSAPQPRRN